MRGHALLFMVVGLAALLRFAFLGQQSLWVDEAVTVSLLHKSLSGMLGAIPGSESTPPLYYVLAWGWSRLFGFGAVGVRSLSALFGTATVLAAYGIGSVAVSRRAGLYAACLVACSPMLVWYSQEARSYALLALLSALSVLAFLHARLGPSPRAVALWTFVSCLALLTHYFAVFTIGAEALWLLRAHPRSKATWAGAAATIAVGLALLPLAMHQAGTGQTSWINAVSLGQRIHETVTQFVAGTEPPAHGAPPVAALAAIVVAAVSLIRFAERAERRGALVVLGLGTVAVLAPLALAETSFDKFFYRNLIAGWVPLATGFAAVLAFRRVGRLGLLVVGTVCAAEICVVVLIVLRPSLQRDDWRGATRAIVAQTGPVAIITVPADQRVPIKLYLPRAQAMPVRGARVREIVFLAPGPIPAAYRPPAGFTETFAGYIQRIALVRYRATYSRLVTPAAVVGHLFTTEDVLFLQRQSAPR